MTRGEQLQAVKSLINARYARFRDLQLVATDPTATPAAVANIGHMLSAIERETAGMTQAAVVMGFTLHEILD
jgi:hypothetical protein